MEKNNPRLGATVAILVAVIGCIGVLGAAFIGVLPDLLRTPTPTSPEASNPTSPTPKILNSPTVVVQDSSTSSESSAPILSGVPGATQRCEEFRGTPIARDSITTDQIETWRQIGKTDRNETARVIYCEIQQVPNFEGFTEGDEIPSGVIITADLGFNWNSMYPESLERLVHDGGGWGVFLSLKSFEVQHADDLPNDVGGQYWVVSQ